MANKPKRIKTTIKKTIIKEFPAKKSKKPTKKIAKQGTKKPTSKVSKKTTRKLVKKPTKKVSKKSLAPVLLSSNINQSNELPTGKIYKVAYITLSEPENNLESSSKTSNTDEFEFPEEIENSVAEETELISQESNNQNELIDKILNALSKRLNNQSIPADKPEMQSTSVDSQPQQQPQKTEQPIDSPKATIPVLKPAITPPEPPLAPVIDNNSNINKNNFYLSEKSKQASKKMKIISIITWVFFALFFLALISIATSCFVVKDDSLRKNLIYAFSGTAAFSFISSIVFYIIKSSFANIKLDEEEEQELLQKEALK